jgi:hypothetical protein
VPVPQKLAAFSVTLPGFVGLVSFSSLTHLWVPISPSPLVAFAPAGDHEMGTEEGSG